MRFCKQVVRLRGFSTLCKQCLWYNESIPHECTVCCDLQESYYQNTKASRFIEAGHGPAAVNLALAYFAANRGDESQVGMPRLSKGIMPQAYLPICKNRWVMLLVVCSMFNDFMLQAISLCCCA